MTVELRLAGVWTDITQYVYLRNPMMITWGRQDEGTQVKTGKCPITINNRDGRFSPRNPTGPYYGVLGRNTAVRISVTLDGGTVSYRFTGEVSAWPQRWDLSGNDRWVTVDASGIFRRLGQGASPLRDSLRRDIEAGGPLAYWPLTDGESALRGSEVATGAEPMRSVVDVGNQGQPDWARGRLAQWLDPVVELPQGTEGRMNGSVAPRALTSWAVDHYRSGIGSPADDLTVIDIGQETNDDPIGLWILGADPAANDLFYGHVLLGDTIPVVNTEFIIVPDPGIFDSNPHMIRITAQDEGGGISSWSLAVDGQVLGSGTEAVPFRSPSRIRYRWGAFGGAPEPLAIGHITYWETPPDQADTHRAMLGHAREPAGRRIERLCAEQGVPLQVHGSLDDTPAMGPQRPARFLDVLRAAEDVDGGVLGEARDELALAYRTRASKYNQGV